MNFKLFTETLEKSLIFRKDDGAAKQRFENSLQYYYTEYRTQMDDYDSLGDWIKDRFSFLTVKEHFYSLKPAQLIKTPELIAEPIRMLSFKQPYAEMMLRGKEYETRSRSTSYRGLVLICSSQKPYDYYDIYDIAGAMTLEMLAILKGSAKDKFNGYQPGKHLLNGYAVAVGRLVDSFEMTKDHEAKAFVQYDSGQKRYCHKYQEVTPIEPFPIKGVQGWKKLDSDIWEKINFIDID